MTPDERKMLSDLADKLAQTPAPPRDPEAEDFIRTRIGNRPDALYMMTQTVLVQNLALQQAQQQIQALQRGGRASTGGSGSFLGQSGSPSGSSFSQSSSQGQGQYSAPQPQYAQASTPSPAPGAAPSFLKGAAQTAAGVAAGALAFEGIRSLFSHPGYGMGGAGFGGGGFGGGYGLGGGAPMEETVVNNYYDNSGGGGGNDAGNFDLSDNRDNFANTDDNDNSSDFDSSDNGGFDDGGDNFS